MPHFRHNLLVLILISLKYAEHGRSRNHTKKVDRVVFETAFFSQNN